MSFKHRVSLVFAARMDSKYDQTASDDDDVDEIRVRWDIWLASHSDV